MTEPVKLVLDGTVFSECEMRGANRDGMMRLTEDVTRRLVKDQSLDISFAGNIFIEKYDRALKTFISNNYTNHTEKVFSKHPPAFTNLLKYRGLFRKLPASLAPYSFYREINKADIFHSFYYPFPQSIMRNKIKRSITLLDIIPLRMKGYPDELVQRTQLIVESIRNNFAISISQCSKNDLLDYCPQVNAENVFVVPLAAAPEIFYQNKDAETKQTIRTKYGLPENYFLCLSGNDSRKNIKHVIKSFSDFVLQEKITDISLVLTGNKMHSTGMLKELGLNDTVIKLICMPDRFIDSSDLAALYSNALAFFFMSRYEGFGLPALEAMQCGTPTVTANNSSLPEVTGNGGIMLDPDDRAALASVMSRLYYDSEYRKMLSEKALQRASLFSWEKTAASYSEVFKTILNR